MSRTAEAIGEGRRAVVIGAGAGGLTSALLLASHGWEVDVYEQHYRPGGFLHRFFRQGAAYDTGFHYCGGVAWEDLLGRVLRLLGIFDDLRFFPLDPEGFDRIVFPDIDITVPVGVAAYRTRMKEHFPHEAKGIDGFIDEIERAVQGYGLYAFKAEVDIAEVLYWEELTVDQVLDRHVRDPQVRLALVGQCMLYGLAPHEAPFGLHAVILHHFLRGAWRIDGGGDRLASLMVKRLKALGGRLHLKTGVRRVLIDGRRACGIELEGGEIVGADLVISNVHPRGLLDMIAPEALRPAYRNRVLDQRVGRAHFGLYAELDGGTELLGNRNLYRFRTTDIDRAFTDTRPGDVPFYFATSPTQGHPLVERRAGREVLLMLAGLSWERVAPWAHLPSAERPPEYHALKAETQTALLEALEADHPGIRAHIRRVESSTGLTTRHFTRAPGGAMYGHHHSVDQMGRYRPAQALRVRNVIQVGAGVFWPGVLGAMISAFYGCAYVLGMKPLLDELEAIPRDERGKP